VPSVTSIPFSSVQPVKHEKTSSYTTAGVNLKVLPRDGGLKWLGSMLTSYGSKLQNVDLQYHLQQASKIFHMNRWILQNRNVSITKRLRYFESVVSSVACFAGGHRTIYNRQLERLDTHFRKLCKSIVGPPPGTDWTLEWQEILHQWNARVNIFIDRANIKTWSRICCFNYWRLAQHVAMLSQERWVRRILRWCPAGTYRIGRHALTCRDVTTPHPPPHVLRSIK